MNEIKLSESRAFSDEEIISEICLGKKELFEIIMRRYNQRLFRIGHSYLNSSEEIEEVMQSAYIKAYEALGRFEFRSRFSTWLIRIFINELLAYKKIKQRSHYFDENLPERNDLGNNSEKSSFDNPYRSTINNELKAILEQAVDNLPEKYRTVFVMREIEDMSVSEVSLCLGISEANVKVRLNRAKEMLRDSLSTYYHFKEVYHFDLVRCDRIVNNIFDRLNKV